MTVSIIVPAFNEESRIRSALRRLSQFQKGYEVIVAADGCTDKTIEIAKQFNVKVICDEKRLGKGAAITNAVRQAEGDIIVTMDVDFKHVTVIPKNVEFVRTTVDFMFSKRVFFTHKPPLARKVAAKLFKAYAQTLFGNLPDTQSSFKIFKKEAFLDVADDSKIKGYAWDVELFVKAKKKGYKIVETLIPDSYEESNFKTVKAGSSMAWSLFVLWLKNHWSKLILFQAVFYLVLIGMATYTTPIPIGADVHFHIDVARIWAAGGNGMFSDIVFQINRFPYPPLFHWIVAPSVWFNLEFLWCRLLQIVFSVGCFVATMLLVQRHVNSKAAAFTGLLLLSSFGFTDGTIQARPQSLDMLLIPIALHFFLSYSNKKFGLSTIALVWNHGVAALSNLWTLFLYGFKRRKWWQTFMITALLVAPILFFSVFYSQGALSTWSGHTETWQEYLVFQAPIIMIPFYAGASLMGYIFIGLGLWKWKQLSDVEKTLIISFVGLTVMIPLWADRFMQYATIPLSCIAAIGFSKKKEYIFAFMAVVGFCLFMNQANLWWINFTGNWWTKW